MSRHGNLHQFRFIGAKVQRVKFGALEHGRNSTGSARQLTKGLGPFLFACTPAIYSHAKVTAWIVIHGLAFMV